MQIRFSKTFASDYKKIKDANTRTKLIKAINKLAENPETGKPLRYNFKDYRRLVVSPFRVLYRLESDCILVNCFEHRDRVYKKKPQG